MKTTTIYSLGTIILSIFTAGCSTNASAHEFPLDSWLSPSHPRAACDQNAGTLPRQPVAAILERTSSYSGRWTVRSIGNTPYEVELMQNGSRIIGVFIDRTGVAGDLEGLVKDGAVHYTWHSDLGYGGDGDFTLSPDGRSIQGPHRTLVSDGSTELDVWTGLSANASVHYTGEWAVVSDEAQHYAFHIDQQGDCVTGSFDGPNGASGILAGFVNNSTLAFRYQTKGGPDGGGTFKMQSDQMGFRGAFYAKGGSDFGTWSTESP